MAAALNQNSGVCVSCVLVLHSSRCSQLFSVISLCRGETVCARVSAILLYLDRIQNQQSYSLVNYIQPYGDTHT
jgi:hypothetical protein